MTSTIMHYCMHARLLNRICDKVNENMKLLLVVFYFLEIANCQVQPIEGIVYICNAYDYVLTQNTASILKVLVTILEISD